MEFHTETKGLEKFFITTTFAFCTLRDKRTVPKPKRILSRLNNGWQEFYLKKCTECRAFASAFPSTGQIFTHKIMRHSQKTVPFFQCSTGNLLPVNWL
jgi:hypothetical protein